MLLKNLSSFQKYAAGFAKKLRPGDTIAFHGDLGAGKTEFSRQIVQSLVSKDQRRQEPPPAVPSPTFTIVQTYETGAGRISHFDLYRVKSANELEEIGFFDSLGRDIVLIEWPEPALPFLPKNTIHIRITPNNNEREVIIDNV